MKLQLPTVTLMCIDCLNANRAIKVLERCKEKADFGAVKLLTNIPNEYPESIKIIPLNTLIAYSVFMLTRVHEYIDTDNVLIVQRDGWILNVDAWDKKWLELDYIGPLFVQYDRVGSGGFSLRKKWIMKEIAGNSPIWDGSQQQAEIMQGKFGLYEDGVICMSEYSKRFKIGSKEQAADFAQGGNRNPKYFREYPFGWHRTWQEIDFKTGRVDSSDMSKDLHSTYDYIIDAL